MALGASVSKVVSVSSERPTPAHEASDDNLHSTASAIASPILLAVMLHAEYFRGKHATFYEPVAPLSSLTPLSSLSTLSTTFSLSPIGSIGSIGSIG